MTSSFWDDCIYRLKWIPCIYTYYLFRRQNVNFLSIKKSPFISCNGNIYIWNKIHSLSVKQKRSQHKTFKRRNVERYKQFFRCVLSFPRFIPPFFLSFKRFVGAPTSGSATTQRVYLFLFLASSDRSFAALEFN